MRKIEAKIGFLKNNTSVLLFTEDFSKVAVTENGFNVFNNEELKAREVYLLKDFLNLLENEEKEIDELIEKVNNIEITDEERAKDYLLGVKTISKILFSPEIFLEYRSYLDFKEYSLFLKIPYFLKKIDFVLETGRLSFFIEKLKKENGVELDIKQELVLYEEIKKEIANWYKERIDKLVNAKKISKAVVEVIKNLGNKKVYEPEMNDFSKMSILQNVLNLFLLVERNYDYQYFFNEELFTEAKLGEKKSELFRYLLDEFLTELKRENKDINFIENMSFLLGKFFEPTGFKLFDNEDKLFEISKEIIKKHLTDFQEFREVVNKIFFEKEKFKVLIEENNKRDIKESFFFLIFYYFLEDKNIEQIKDMISVFLEDFESYFQLRDNRDSFIEKYNEFLKGPEREILRKILSGNMEGESDLTYSKQIIPLFLITQLSSFAIFQGKMSLNDFREVYKKLFNTILKKQDNGKKVFWSHFENFLFLKSKFIYFFISNEDKNNFNSLGKLTDYFSNKILYISDMIMYLSDLSRNNPEKFSILEKSFFPESRFILISEEGFQNKFRKISTDALAFFKNIKKVIEEKANKYTLREITILDFKIFKHFENNYFNKSYREFLKNFLEKDYRTLYNIIKEEKIYSNDLEKESFIKNSLKIIFEHIKSNDYNITYDKSFPAILPEVMRDSSESFLEKFFTTDASEFEIPKDEKNIKIKAPKMEIFLTRFYFKMLQHNVELMKKFLKTEKDKDFKLMLFNFLFPDNLTANDIKNESEILKIDELTKFHKNLFHFNMLLSTATEDTPYISYSISKDFIIKAIDSNNPSLNYYLLNIILNKEIIPYRNIVYNIKNDYLSSKEEINALSDIASKLLLSLKNLNKKLFLEGKGEDLFDFLKITKDNLVKYSYIYSIGNDVKYPSIDDLDKFKNRLKKYQANCFVNVISLTSFVFLNGITPTEIEDISFLREVTKGVLLNKWLKDSSIFENSFINNGLLFVLSLKDGLDLKNKIEKYRNKEVTLDDYKNSLISLLKIAPIDKKIPDIPEDKLKRLTLMVVEGEKFFGFPFLKKENFDEVVKANNIISTSYIKNSIEKEIGISFKKEKGKNIGNVGD